VNTSGYHQRLQQLDEHFADDPQRVGQAGEVIAAGDEAQHEAKGHADEDLYAERWAGHAPNSCVIAPM
jgi:hypothetical protein